MVDYRKFLGPTEPRVAPYFGGGRVVFSDRRLRVQTDRAPGFYRFAIEGRRARLIEAADLPDIASWPALRGHLFGPMLFAAGGHAEPIWFLPTEEPPRFAPVVARRSHEGPAVFEMLDFETEVEEEARRAFEEERTLAGYPAVPSSLRAAFGFAVIQRVAFARGVEVRPVEARSVLAAVAETGAPRAAAWLADLVDRRSRYAQLHRPARVEAFRMSAARDRDQGFETRAEAALDAAGARLRGVRRLDRGQHEVRFEFDGERFVAVVEGTTLGVIDAGICLDGADRELTLDSLPSAIREAIDTGQLVITRHA